MHQVLKNIKYMRKSNGYSQDEIAKALGITQSSYARFENESVKIDFKVMEKVAEILKVEVADIIYFHEGKKYETPTRQEQSEYTMMIENLRLMVDALKEQVKDKQKIIDYVSKDLDDCKKKVMFK